MDKLDLTLLNYYQLINFFEFHQLKILELYGYCALGTDLVTLLGGHLNEKMHVSVPSIANMCGSYWLWPTKHFKRQYFGLRAVDTKGVHYFPDVSDYSLMIRPVLHLSLEELEKLKIRKNDWNITYTYYLEYPQFVVDKKKNDLLEEKYQQQALISTGKEYTFKNNFQLKKFEFSKYPEYSYDNEKYIRIEGLINAGHKLANGEKIVEGKPYFVKVSPIKWLYDEPTRLLISERGLVSGIRFHSVGTFESIKETEMYQYVSNYLSQEIIPSETKSSVILDGDEELQKVMFKGLQSRRRT